MTLRPRIVIWDLTARGWILFLFGTLLAPRRLGALHRCRLSALDGENPAGGNDA